MLSLPFTEVPSTTCVILWQSGAPLKPTHILHLSLDVVMFHGLTKLQITDSDISSLGHSRSPDGFCSLVI